jgi:hypothetical protein
MQGEQQRPSREKKRYLRVPVKGRKDKHIESSPVLPDDAVVGSGYAAVVGIWDGIKCMLARPPCVGEGLDRRLAPFGHKVGRSRNGERVVAPCDMLKCLAVVVCC